MNILVTGAAGQLGKTIAKVVHDSDNRYIFCNSRELDITDGRAVEDFVLSNSVDVIINCASYTVVDRAEDEPELADAVNHRAVADMAMTAARHGVTLIHISTDYVFGGTGGTAYDEDAVPSPVNVYGRTKADGERAITVSGCNYIILRTSWLYGHQGRNFVNTIYEKSADMPVLKVVADQIGSPTYADDLACFIIRIIEEGMLDRTGIYNYSNEGVCSWYDFAHEICAQSGHLCDILPCKTDEFPRKAERPRFSVLDKTKVKKVFGMEIPHWKDSLTIYMNTLK